MGNDLYFRFYSVSVLTMKKYTTFTPQEIFTPQEVILGIYRVKFPAPARNPKAVVRRRAMIWASVQTPKLRVMEVTDLGSDVWEISTREVCTRCGQ